MPYLKCLDCMHEWEGDKDSKCDWCGSKSRILEEETPMESYVKEMIKDPEAFHEKVMPGVKLESGE